MLIKLKEIETEYLDYLKEENVIHQMIIKKPLKILMLQNVFKKEVQEEENFKYFIEINHMTHYNQTYLI